MKITAAIICFIAAANLYPLAWQGFYYQANAAGLLLLFWHLYSHSLAGKIGFWFSLNNLLDELLFDPASFQIHEYLFAIILTTHLLWQATRKNKALLLK